MYVDLDQSSYMREHTQQFTQIHKIVRKSISAATPPLLILRKRRVKSDYALSSLSETRYNKEWKRSNIYSKLRLSSVVLNKYCS